MRHTKYLEGVLRWYEEQLITPGDPNEGRWEEAHTPLPRNMGDTTVLLLRQHHFIHDLWQSKELDECHFFTGQVKDLYRPGLFPADWFELCDIAEEYSRKHGVKGGKATPEVVARRNESNRGQKRTKEARLKMSLRKLGVPKSEDFKENLRVKMAGEGNPFYGKRHTEESLLKMSSWQQDLPPIECPHCKFTSPSKGMMSRWHFDNCKHRVH